MNLQNIFYVVSIGSMIFAFFLWQKKQIWNNKYEVSRELMIAFIKYYQSIKFLRWPFIDLSEGHTLAKRKLKREPNYRYNYDNQVRLRMAFADRFNKVLDIKPIFDGKILEAGVIFQQKFIETLFNNFNKVVSDIFFYTQRRIDDSFDHVDKESDRYKKIMEHTDYSFTDDQYDQINEDDNMNTNNEVNRNLINEYEKIISELKKMMEIKLLSFLQKPIHCFANFFSFIFGSSEK